MLGGSFHNSFVLGIKHLECWEVLNLIGEKDKVNTQATSCDSPGTQHVGKFRMKSMRRIVKDLAKHTLWANETTVLQTNGKIKKLKISKLGGSYQKV